MNANSGCGQHNTMGCIIFLLNPIASSPIFAQNNVGIGTNTHNNSAKLDIDVSSDVNRNGLLIPRVNLLSTSDVVIRVAPANCLLIYNTNAAITGTAANRVGFYFWNGTFWTNLMGYGIMTTEFDWYKKSTTDALTSINDNIYCYL